MIYKKTVNRVLCKKDVQTKIFYWVKKKRLVWGVFRYRRRYVTKHNATGLKEGRRNINVKLQVLSILRDARSLRFEE
jgi:hypothetical protein